MNYKQTLDILYAMLPDFQDKGAEAYKPGLERIREFDLRLGSPDRSFHTVHVAGTNGKGSVSHMLASVLMSAGYRTGLYTSPHLYDFRERIRVDGEPISEKGVVDFAREYLPLMEELGLSFFEAAVGMAFDWFRWSNVEVAVIETGLGGRLDATNIVEPLLSVITNIGVDHASLLGSTVPEIAGEKAGIIKPGVPVVVGQKDPQSAPVFEAAAKAKGSELYFAEDYFRYLDSEINDDKALYRIKKLSDGTVFTLESDLTGGYQRHNILTALTALGVLDRETPLYVSARAIREGMSNVSQSTGLTGRWQVAGREPLVVFDTGHNAHGIEEVVAQISREKYEKLFIVFGMAGDKDWEAILPLLPRDAYYYFTQARGSRAMPAGELAARAARFGLAGEVVPEVAKALEKARSAAGPRDMIFVGGSTFVVAEAGNICDAGQTDKNS